MPIQLVRCFDARAAASAPAAILACDCPPVAAAPLGGGLSLRSMRRGSEEIALDGRRLVVDDDCYLILDGARAASCRYGAERAARTLVVFFDRAVLVESLGGREPPTFLPHLRAHGDAVTAQLARIEQALERGLDDATWFEQQTLVLLHAMVESERALLGRAERIASVKPATRSELLRRVLLAADFMTSHHDQPIRLEHIAEAARLSRFHLVRLFRQVQGVTPHEYLLAKRLAVARRLLRETRLDLAEIAARSGFGTRHSLFRHLHKRLGAGGRLLRTPAPLASEPCPIAA